MGLGISQLLTAHNYDIITNVTDRSAATQERAKAASIQLLPSDAALVKQADYILSIVPPRDAVATAKRVVEALKSGEKARRTDALYYLDLNAIAPRTAKEIDVLFKKEAPLIRFIDGGIIGGPPSHHPSPPPTTTAA